MWALAAVLAFVALCKPAYSTMTWSQCFDGPFDPSSVALTPDPPQIGDKISFDIQGEYVSGDDVVIPSGTLDVSVDFMGTPIFQTEWDLCSKTSCPIEPGTLEIHYGQTLPPIAPPGDYQVRLVAYDDNHKELFCLLVNFDISPPWSTGVLRSQG